MAIDDRTTATTRTAPDVAVSDTGRSYVDWGPIFAGAALAAAVALVLGAFGTALGLSLTSVREGEGLSATWMTVAAALWFVWMSVSSYGAGGYLAGRLRRRTGHGDRDEVEMRDGAHGLVVWAIGAVLGAMLTASGVGLLGSAAASAAGTATQAAGSAAGGAASALIDESDLGYRVSSLFRAEGTGQVVDERVRTEATSLLQRAVARGELAEEDRVYLANLLAANTGLDPAGARQRIDAGLADLEQARRAAVEAAEDARRAGVIAGFFVAATLLVGAAAAYAAAVAGGQHRDENTAFILFGASPRRVDVL